MGGLAKHFAKDDARIITIADMVSRVGKVLSCIIA